MAQPTTYDRQSSFTLLAAEDPSSPYTGADLDEEFNAVKVTLDEILANMALIQRDDGDLANDSVGLDQLGASAIVGFENSAWLTATAYTLTDSVFENGVLYKCIVAHTSGTFATDLAASKWELVADFGALTISDGSVTTAKLAALAVTTAKLDALAVTSGKIAADAVTTAKILDANVTTAKIAASNVTYAKIQDVSATDMLLGRSTAGSGVVEEIACTAAGRALLDDASASAQRTTLGVTSTVDLASTANALGASLIGIEDSGGYFTATTVEAALAEVAVESIIVAVTNEVTPITTGTSKVKFRMPYAFKLSAIRASLSTAQTSGSVVTVDVNESGTTILSTKLTFDNAETTTTTAATPPVISDSALADDAEITIDVDQVGDGTAIGLKVVLIGRKV